MLILIILFSIKIKDTKLYVLLVTFSVEDYQKLSELSSKGFEIVRMKVKQKSIDIFLNKTLEDITNCLF